MQHQFLGKLLKKIEIFFSFIAFSNLFVSLCVYCFTLQTILVFGLKELESIALFNALSTFVIYNTQRIFQYYSGHKILASRSIWLKNNISLLWLLLFICILLLVYISWNVLYFLIPFYALFAFVALLYFIPGINLRKIPYLKIFIVALIWVMSCCFIPEKKVLVSGAALNIYMPKINVDMLLYSCAQFLFISLLCLPFDIRDIEIDKKRAVKTFPTLLGVKGTQLLCYFLTAFYFALILMMQNNVHILLPCAITGLITTCFIYYSHPRRSPLFFSLLIDGLIIVQYLLILLAHQLN